MEKFLWNDKHYHFLENLCYCCLWSTLPVGCSLSLFSIIPLFVFNGTRGERSMDNVKRNVLPLRKIAYCIEEHDSTPVNNCRKRFYVTENLYFNVLWIASNCTTRKSLPYAFFKWRKKIVIFFFHLKKAYGLWNVLEEWIWFMKCHKYKSML